MTGSYTYTIYDPSGSTDENHPRTVENVDFTTPQVIPVRNPAVQRVQSIHMSGVIEANGTSGDVQMLVAQALSDSNPTTISKNLTFNVFNAN